MTRLQQVHLEASNALGELAKHFKPEMKLTFIARHPEMTECHVIVTSDDLSELRDLLGREVAAESAKAANKAK